MTLSEADFFTEALKAIETVKTEQELLDWDEETSTDTRYLCLPESAVRQLEAAYDRKLRELTGWGAP